MLRRSLALVGGTIALLVACSYESSFQFKESDGGDSDTLSTPVDNRPASCSNGQRDADESDVDCGGGGCQPCAIGQNCSDPSHCVSLSCAGNAETGATCQPPSYFDGVKNGSETGVDCGGDIDAPLCPSGQGCHSASDCQHGVCTAEGMCSSPGATDGVQNGSETDIDCGGPVAPPCTNGKTCILGTDCTSGACNAEFAMCTPATAADGVKNGSETDIDCGGPEPGVPRCNPGKRCDAGVDCNSQVCSAGGLCQPPTGSDGVQNGNETDVDCGGDNTGADRCAPGKRCELTRDCTLGCNYNGRCGDTRSCTQHFGGDTCGRGETPAQGLGPQHESCCAEGTAFQSGGQTVTLDKYLYTAGRMRAMIAQENGRLRNWIQQHRPAWFRPAWDALVPNEKWQAEMMLGPYGGTPRGGCSFSDSGRTSARTYDTDTDITGSNGQPDRAAEISRALLDEKPLNCVTWVLAQVACAYDGRRLASAAVINAAVAGPDGRANPWGNAPAMSPGAPAAAAARELTQGFYSSYLNAGINGTFAYRWPLNANLENSRGIPAPGRMHNSRGAWGHLDLYGPMLHWTDEGVANDGITANAYPAAQRFFYTYSWEGHGRQMDAQAYSAEAYHAIGFRCMRVIQ